ncbi:MAG: hypothetical protein PHH13_04880 [Candidatus Peribacteraceae bacterium]|nr:hypothetical protein [Candidatus Peribacteraceae bacterium]
MPESERPSREDLAERAWDKVIQGQGLTPSESEALHGVRGIHFPATVPEPEPATSAEVVRRTEGISFAVSQEVRADMSNRNLQDLVTGETVVNIVPREPTPADNLRITPRQVNGLSAYYQAGRSADIRLIVQEVDRVILPGFLQFLSEEERGQLGNASPALIRRIHHEIMRLFLADRTHVLAAKLSRGIDRHVVPLLPRVRDAHARASIEACVDVWKANERNPYRSLCERTARSAHDNPEVHAEYRIPLASVDARYISLGIIQGEAALVGAEAAYSASTRTMFLHEPPQERELDFLEILAAIHELTHVVHDAKSACQLGVTSTAYRQSIAQVPPLRMVGIVDEDPEAIGNEVELLIARTGFGTMEVGRVAQMLEVRLEERAPAVYGLMQYATQYFPHGRGSDGRMSRRFVAYVESKYRERGALIFQRNAEGILVPKDPPADAPH